MNNKQIKAGIILSYLNIFLGFVISIIYTPFMLRSFGENEYGLYTLVSSIVGYLGLLNFGFSHAYMRYYSKYKSNNDSLSLKKLNGMFLMTFACLGLLILVIGISIIPGLSTILGDKLTPADVGIAKVLFFIMVINLAIPLFTTPFNLNVIAHEKFIFLKLVTVFKTVLFPFIMVPLLLIGYKSITLSIVTLIFTILCELIITVYSIKKLKISFVFYDLKFSLLKEIAVFSFFVFLLMIIDQINWNVDKFLLGRYKGTYAVATYGVAFQINYYYLLLSTQISSVFIPRVNHIIASKNSNQELSKLFNQIGRLQFMLLAAVLLGFIFFGKVFIEIWAGKEYIESYYVILCLIGPVTFSLIQNIGIEIQRAKNMHKTITVIYLILALLNVVISIPLIKSFGAIGAAFGTGVSLIIGNVIIVNIYYHYKVGLDVISFWKEILKLVKASIIPFIVGVLLNQFVSFDNLGMYVISGMIFVITYIACMWMFGMNDFEKGLILRFREKAMKKFSH